MKGERRGALKKKKKKGKKVHLLKEKLPPTSWIWGQPARHPAAPEGFLLVVVPLAPRLTAAILFSLLLLKRTLGKLRFRAQFTGVFPLRTAFNCMLESN